MKKQTIALLTGAMLATMSLAGTAQAEESGGTLLFFAIGNLGDMGINDLGWKASQELAEKYDLELTVVEGTSDASVRTTSLLDALETGGYDYCVTGSWYIESDLLANMDAYADTKFVIYDTSPLTDYSDYPNVTGIAFKQNEGSFMAGLYECLMSETKKVGAIANMDSPILNDFITGWLAGVKYYNDNYDEPVEYSVSYLSDITVTNNYETASTLYGSGCDIIYNISGTSGLGCAQAAEEAGAIMIGVDYDQYEVYKQSESDVVGVETVATSMQKKIQESIVKAMSNVIEGTSDTMGVNVGYTMAMGGVGLAKNEKYEEVTPDDVKTQIDEVEQKIISGEITVPSFFDFAEYDEFATFRDDPESRLN